MMLGFKFWEEWDPIITLFPEVFSSISLCYVSVKPYTLALFL